MRLANVNPADQQSFKGNPIQSLITPPSRSRIWISLQQGTDISSLTAPLKQTLLGYATGATDGATDRNFDSPAITPITNSIIDVYSIAPATTTKLAIQGKNLLSSFNFNDFFQLGFSAPAGAHTFTGIGDGLFNGGQGAVQYFIFDASNNSINSLPYTFTLSVAESNNVTRFRVVFKAILTQLQASQCGVTIAKINTEVFADNVSGANRYRWRFVSPNNLPNTQLETLLRRFTFTELENLASGYVLYNTTYQVQAASRINGIWQPYGPICNVTTPSIPIANVNCTIVTSSNIYLTTNPGQAVTNQPSPFNTNYRFRLRRNGSNDLFYTNGIIGFAQCQLKSSFFIDPSGINVLLPSTQYNISVALIINNTQIGNYGPECSITTPGNVNKLSVYNGYNTINNFAIANPNPFTNNFNLKLANLNNEAVEFKIYDMFGKLVDSFNIIDSEIENLEIGNNYNSGIYNIVISSSDNIFTQRIIKK
ncbi:T9SS type A sorting domain-containing protein [Flavobacterium sp.]|uniref:T9SS type A sorting domain-containing protein n=1 Tax=Flavobacterium sp. TaxID=239 RepID=UPI0037508648